MHAKYLGIYWHTQLQLKDAYNLVIERNPLSIFYSKQHHQTWQTNYSVIRMIRIYKTLLHHKPHHVPHKHFVVDLYELHYLHYDDRECFHIYQGYMEYIHWIITWILTLYIHLNSLREVGRRVIPKTLWYQHSKENMGTSLGLLRIVKMN